MDRAAARAGERLHDPDGAETLAREVMRRGAGLEEERREWEELWRELSEYILPRRGWFDRDRGKTGVRSKGTRIVDGAASRAIRVLASGLQGGLTSPARPWFRLGLDDRDLGAHGPVRKWLGRVERIMYQALAGSNFYAAVHSLYLELACFGTGVLFVEDDYKSLVRFRCLTAGEYCLALDSRDRPDTVFRRIRMTAAQMAERFGVENLPERAVRSLEKNPDQWFETANLIRPRSGAVRLGPDMGWECLSLETGSRKLLSAGGYVGNPCMAPRWDTAGSDVYGRSPAMDVLPDCRMLQEMARSQIMAIHKVVNPPMRVPAMYARRLNLLPGGENPVEHGREDGIRPLFQITPDIAAVEAKIRDTRQAVREGFFNDLFLMLLDKPNMTATEVAERHEEKLLMLGPVVERQESELLNPLLARVFALLDRSGRIPPRPEVLAGRDFRLEYVSVLSQAQRLIGTQPIRGLAAFAGQLCALRPEILDKLDLDAALDEYAAMIGAPPAMLRDKGEVARIRRERVPGVTADESGLTAGEAEDGGSGSD